VWSTKYRYKVLLGDVRLRVRDIIRQVCGENGVDIIRGVLSSDHVHMCSVPDDHIDPRRWALFVARSILTEMRDGGRTC
jgi:REP element-mobilizing transposase RayT